MALPRTCARRAIARVAALAIALASAAVPALAADRDPRGPKLFDRWAATRAEEVDRYRRFLEAKGVGAVVPMHQLLRTASAWDTPPCRAAGAEPFELPPEAAWPAMATTLRLVQALRADGWLGPVEVVSAYRSDAVNACSDGRPASRHRLNTALDLLPTGASLAASVASLCAFHAQEGARWNMGLSVYPSGRIHVDTAGHRSWGADGTRATSACLAAGPVPPARR
jgi:hypothetical protein